MMQFRSCLSQDANSVQIEKKERKGQARPIELPSAISHPGGEDSDDEESGMGDRPWTRTELKTKAKQKIGERRRNRGAPRAHSEEKSQHAHAPSAADGTPDEAKEDGDGSRDQMWWRNSGTEKKVTPAHKKSSLREPTASGWGLSHPALDQKV